MGYPPTTGTDINAAINWAGGCCLALIVGLTAYNTIVDGIKAANPNPTVYTSKYPYADNRESILHTQLIERLEVLQGLINRYESSGLREKPHTDIDSRPASR